jgi:hypothetical protein
MKSVQQLSSLLVKQEWPRYPNAPWEAYRGISNEKRAPVDRNPVVPKVVMTRLPLQGLTWRPQRMPLGDAQRTWFREMVARLRSEWHAEVSMPTLIGLRDELDGTLHRIRDSRNFRTPIVTCRRCGMTGPGAEPHVSVRALILALARFGIASKEEARALEKAWAEYRKQQRLDVEGKLQGSLPALTIPSRPDSRGSVATSSRVPTSHLPTRY